MADQRRRGGRGRSGRGGKIPRRGEGQQSTTLHDESFVSFPLETSGPIRVNGTLDEAAVEGVLQDTLARERRQVAALASLAERSGDSTVASLRAEADRHREALEQLVRELGAEGGAAEEAAAAGEGPRVAEMAADQRLLRLGWLKLQTVAYAGGDKRIDRVVKTVLRDQQRHTEVLDELAVRSASASLFRDAEY
jgi:hypothetical protein